MSKTKKNQTEFSLPIASHSMRRTCGFHIYPEFELIISALAARNPKLKKKGVALEYIANSFLSGLPEEKREELLKTMNGELEW